MAVAGTNLSFETDFKDHLDTRGLTFDDLRAHQCSDSDLLKLSKNLGNWDTAGLYLELAMSEIKAIKVDNGSEESRRAALLNKWKQKNGDNATYYNLISGLCDADRIDIADQALDCLKRSIIKIRKHQEIAWQVEEEQQEEEQRQQEMQLEYEMKENFITRIKSKLLSKGLDVPDLQMNLRQEDIDSVAELIRRDWYTFGKNMKIEESTLDHIKEVAKDKLGRKKKLLEHLISKKVCFEDIMYGLIDSAEQPEESYKLPELEENQDRSYKKQNSRSKYQDQSSTPSLTAIRQRIPVPWQAKFDERRKKPPASSQLIQHSHLSDLTPDNYQEHFYSALWFEEDEHIKKLSRKCDGVDYKLTIYDQKKVPPFLVQNPFEYTHKIRYGYISGLSDDKIEYATQASDNVTISLSDSSTRLCIAFKHHYNFNHLENCLYIITPNSPELSEAMKNGTKVEEGKEISVSAQFIVKYSYFDHLQHAVVKAPEYVLKCLLPNFFSFDNLFLTFNPRYSDFRCMKLDEKCQLKALEMIVSESPSTEKPTPPVILYGPFGTGKTRILARAAFEVMMNGVDKRKCTRILISAHHEISITTFIFAYFGLIQRKGHLPFQIFQISRRQKKGVYADMCMTPEEFARNSASIRKMSHIIIIATYTTSLNLYQHLYSPEGFFTHLFLDEAAQVREPEAIAPLALATKDAKIVLAGDTQQVGPNILVLGEEAKKFGLNVSLLERLLMKYEEIGSVAARYVTKLSVNYRSHNSLIDLPNLFYENLEINPDKSLQKCSGPTGYKFVSTDSKLIEQFDDPDQQWVEACIVLEEVRSYLERIKQINPIFNPRHDVCIITSTRKQLNRIKSMAFDYNEYEAVRKVTFKPSFMIQGHEFQAIFLSLFELVEDDKMNTSYIKSLFNPYVFNTVITKAKCHVVAIGSPEEVRKFELDTLSHPDRGGNTTKCWHEYLNLCVKQGTLSSSKQSLPYKISELIEFTCISLDDEVSALSDTLSPDEIYDLENIYMLNEKLKSSTKKLVAKDKEVRTMKVTLDQCQEELIRKRSEEKIASKISTIKGELSQCKLEFKTEIETSKNKFEDKIASIKIHLEGLRKEKFTMQKEKESVANRLKELEEEKLTALKDQTMYAAKLNREKEDLRSTMQSKLDEKDVYAKELEKKNEELISKNKEFAAKLSQFKMIKSTEEKLEIDSGCGFRASSTVKVSKKFRIGLYTIFLLFLVATCWKPDPKIFISPLPGVKVIASNRLLVAGGQSSQLHWEEYGLMLDIPSDALPHGFLAEVVIRVSVSGPYVYPDPKTWKPASAVYWISSSKEFVNPVLLGIWHNVKGSVNSSSIKILTAEDTPQNMSYIFNEFLGDFSIKGSYIYFKLTSFSSKTAITNSEVKFQGTLFYRKSETYKWDYSLVIYRSQVNGVRKSLLDDADYEGWSQETKDFGVIFEKNSTILELNITTDPPVENWEVQEKFTPLSYDKDELQSQVDIESNMQFMLYWSGSGPFLVSTCLKFPLKGAKRPTTITVNPSTSNLETESKDTKFINRMKQKLGTEDLNEVILVLKDSSFDYSKWEDLGLNLGLFVTNLNTIEKDNSKNSEACLRDTLEAWLKCVDNVDKKGGANYNALVDALVKIDRSVAEKIKKTMYIR